MTGARPDILFLSANTATSLKDQVDHYHEFVQANETLSSHDIAYTLATKREHLPHRAYAIVQDGEFLETSALAKASAKVPNVYLIFSGQGAQWPGMCKELALTDPSFEADLRAMDAVLKGLAHPPSWTIIGKRAMPPVYSMFRHVLTAAQMSS